jgi:phosphatidylglycerophosphate synthase
VRTVRIALAAGPVGQVLILAGLAATAGVSSLAWLVGTAYAVMVTALLARGLHRAGANCLGWANTVTLLRAILVGAVAALVTSSWSGAGASEALVALAAVALVLDAVDGNVARRTGAVSALGQRFDMEVDAFLIFVLSVYVAHTTGAWVMAIGLARYAFVAAWVPLPWLRGPVPPRHWRKVVAATQGVVLTVAAAGVLPVVLTEAALAVALTLLTESFGRDVLWRHRASAAVPTRPATRRADRPVHPAVVPALTDAG